MSLESLEVGSPSSFILTHLLSMAWAFSSGRAMVDLVLCDYGGEGGREEGDGWREAGERASDLVNC